MIIKRLLIIFSAAVYLLICNFPLHASGGDVILRYPEEKVLAQIIENGLAFRHEKALAQADEYIQRHPNHPCGYFALGLVQEWIIEPQEPEPPLTPAINAFERAGAMPVNTAEGSYDAAAAICRGAAFMHLTRIYYKYDKMLLGIRRAMAASHELETVAQRAPEAYDAYTFLGPYHYFTDRTPAAARFVMKLFGLKGDRNQGLNELRLAWEKAPLFNATAGQTLYVIRSQYEGDFHAEKGILENLLQRYPDNLIFQKLWERSKNQLTQTALHTLN